jgi:hypothetical protein
MSNNANEIKHAVAVFCKYLGPTNTRGARVKLTLPAYGVSKVIPYSYEHSGYTQTAIAFLRGWAIQPEYDVEGETGSVLIINPLDYALLRTAFAIPEVLRTPVK